MSTSTLRAFLTMGLLATSAAAAAGCVADRPSRNGVFNENQYLRKDFLIQPGDGSGSDSGWIMKATIAAASEPNPLANLDLFVGAENGGDLVRFIVTQDHLDMVSLREIDDDSNADQGTRVPEVENAWPITNVDLKYQINLDGEKTNLYQENQELDWQVRQWVKINFAKNDMSDVAALGPAAAYWLSTCADAGSSSASLVDGSFVVDEQNDYMQWTVQVTVPLLQQPPDSCSQAMEASLPSFNALGRTNVTFDVMYSFMRAVPESSLTYQSLVLDEKDPIQHKYGVLREETIDRDTATGLLASRQVVRRYDPTKPLVWYFAAGYPNAYKGVFTNPGGVQDQTNDVLAASGAAIRVKFLNNDDLAAFNDHAGPTRQYGDVRYNFIRFESDLDTDIPFLGATQFVTDPRTGESLSASINLGGVNFLSNVVQFIDQYLQTIGQAPVTTAADGTQTIGVNSSGEWDPGPANCQPGDTMPVDPTAVTTIHDQNSTLFYEMQKALNMPAEIYGPMGPENFIAQQDDDFRRAYFAVIPYMIYDDPATNPYVIPEAQQAVYGPVSESAMWAEEQQFQSAAASIDQGLDPFQGVTGPTGLANATAFMNTMRDLSSNHDLLTYARSVDHPDRFYDIPGMISLNGVMGKDSRQCILDPTTNQPRWQTKEEWVESLIDSYWAQVVTHEFGHALGLMHNYMASVDEPNYPHYFDQAKPPRDHVGMNASSVMDYNATADRVFWYTGNDAHGNPISGWGPYDKAAIAFVYGNTAPNAVPSGAPVPGISGQVSASAPWNDPLGFNSAGAEIPFLECSDTQTKYTPLCQIFDLGSTPSEIIANEIDDYEANYKFRNFRQYFKYWDDSAYANGPQRIVTDMRRFLSMWAFDWSSGELTDTLRRIGITPPDPNGSAQNYYTQLTNKFTNEMSAANSMVAAFHQAVVQQSSGERPYKTVYDPFFGDVTQQGIILDKYFATLSWTGLWPTTNYDQNQAGSYLAAYAGFGEPFYDDVSQAVVNNMVGGGYDVYPWFVPSAVALFAQDTHSPSFAGAVSTQYDVRDWIGGHVFTRLEDFQDYFREIAVQNGYVALTTEATTNVTAAPNGAQVTIHIPNVTGISVGDLVLVDSGDNQEQTRVVAVSGSGNATTPNSQPSITVTLTLAHTAPYEVQDGVCTTVDACSYDPTLIANVDGQYPGEFSGPDHRIWIYAYVPDRNEWVAADRQRNVATYLVLHNYNLDVLSSADDGAFPGNAYPDELPIKYVLDAFDQYN